MGLSAADEIASNRGGTTTPKRAKDHAKCARAPALASVMVGIAAAAIASRKGQAKPYKTASAHAVVAISTTSNWRSFGMD